MGEERGKPNKEIVYRTNFGCTLPSTQQQFILSSCTHVSRATLKTDRRQITGETMGWDDRWSNYNLPLPGPMPRPFALTQPMTIQYSTRGLLLTCVKSLGLLPVSLSVCPYVPPPFRWSAYVIICQWTRNPFQTVILSHLPKIIDNHTLPKWSPLNPDIDI